MADATVLDASVAINVLGCGEAETVLRAFPGRIIVPDVTSREIFRDPLHPDRHTDPLAPFIQSGLIERISLDGTALNTFMRLVSADAPDDLGDGESASIALADVLSAS